MIERLRTAAADITNRGGAPEIAVVLGSGLSAYAAGFTDGVTMPYASIPGFPTPQVEGHAGALTMATIGDKRVALMAGRVHFYEGWDPADVVFGVRTVALAGAQTVILTNAAGGVGSDLSPGDLVALTDHLNLTGRNPLHGPNIAELGPRFPDMSAVYSATVRSHIHAAADSAGVDMADGVYAWFTGPSYETPAEVQMAKRLGADLVGMSTVPEAIALNHMGVAVGAISLVTNLAAGISQTPLSHDEVTETATAARESFTQVVDALLRLL